MSYTYISFLVVLLLALADYHVTFTGALFGTSWLAIRREAVLRYAFANSARRSLLSAFFVGVVYATVSASVCLVAGALFHWYEPLYLAFTSFLPGVATRLLDDARAANIVDLQVCANTVAFALLWIVVPRCVKGGGTLTAGRAEHKWLRQILLSYKLLRRTTFLSFVFHCPDSSQESDQREVPVPRIQEFAELALREAQRRYGAQRIVSALEERADKLGQKGRKPGVVYAALIARLGIPYFLNMVQNHLSEERKTLRFELQEAECWFELNGMRQRCEILDVSVDLVKCGIPSMALACEVVPGFGEFDCLIKGIGGFVCSIPGLLRVASLDGQGHRVVLHISKPEDQEELYSVFSNSAPPWGGGAVSASIRA